MRVTFTVEQETMIRKLAHESTESAKESLYDASRWDEVAGYCNGFIAYYAVAKKFECPEIECSGWRDGEFSTWSRPNPNYTGGLTYKFTKDEIDTLIEMIDNNIERCKEWIEESHGNCPQAVDEITGWEVCKKTLGR